MAIETNSEEGNGKKIKSKYELFDITMISSKKYGKLISQTHASLTGVYIYKYIYLESTN